MAIRAFHFKSDAAILHHGLLLVRAGFPCNRPARIPGKPPQTPEMQP
jgi:hypothetical protein